MEKATSKQSSLDLQVTDAGFSTRSASSAAGSKRKNRRLSKAAIRQIYTMHSAGLTNYRISKKLGIAAASVSYHLNKGIPAELYVPPTKVQAQEVSPTPSVWSRIRSWFN